MSVSRRQFLSITGASAAGLLLGACAADHGGNPTQSGSGSAGVPDPNRTITNWATFSNSEQGRWYQKNVVDVWNGSSDIGKVKLTLKPLEGFEDNVELALKAGKGPDTFAAGIPQLVRWNSAGFLLPLDEISAAHDWSSKFQPWALDLGRVDGKQLWVPDQVETMIVFYNPGVFANNGWAFPRTFSDFEAICQDAVARGMTPIAAGSADWYGAGEWHLGFHLNHGAGTEAVYRGLTGDLRWTDPVFVDAVSRLNDYMQKGWYGGGPERYFTTKFDAMYRDLANGKAAFIFTGSWGLAEIGPFFGSAAGNDADWDWQISRPLSPAGPVDVYQLSTGQNMGINAKTSAPDLVGGFLDFFLTDVNIATSGLAEVELQPAPIKLVGSDFKPGMDPRTGRLFSGIGNATNIGYTTWTFWPGEVDTYMVTDIDKVFAGKVTPEAFLQKLDEKYQTFLTEGKTMPIPKPTA